MIGRTISHYRILEKLGGGGMGIVYKALDLKLDRFVALKFLLHQLSDDEDAKQRFVHEAKAVSALDYNNICTIYEIDETGEGQMFIAMAYYEGESLKQQMARGKLQIDEAIDVAMQIAQGLSKAHEKGIVHRDVKPANVMLTKDGVAKIVDFGLAKLAGAIRLTRTGTTMGTPAYMSPEQAGTLDVDHRADIWSLGVVLYEMLAGRLPFNGENEVMMIYSILQQEPEPLQKYLPNCSTKLLQIVNRALEKARDNRYPSMNDMLRDLHNARNESRQSSGKRKAPDETVSVSLAPPEDNPYLNRLMIQNPRDFYGRSTELTRIYERIKAVRPQSISIVGVRRIGKSSLLKAIHHPENRRKYLPNSQEYVFVFMDLQARRNVELAEFFQYIYSELQREYPGALAVEADPDYDGLRKVVHDFQESGLKLIFLWDEFESVTKNQKFGPEFYAYFRALANNFNVAYITSSAGQLQSLCHAKEISDSPFFNIFTNQHLSVFKPDEARRLIVEPSAKAGKPLAAHVDFVLDLAGYFPFFIQMACSALYFLPQAEKPDYKKAREIFMEEARPHFKEYCERFDESEKAVVAALAKGKKPQREHSFALKGLAQAGFIVDGKLFSSLFTEFVRETMCKNRPWWQAW